MTKPNLFSALNEAIAQRGDLLTVRQNAAEIAAETYGCFDALRALSKKQHEERVQVIDDMEKKMFARFDAAIKKLDAVIGEDPAEQKQAA